MTVTIFHNPRCSKSRQTLELIRGKRIEPNIVLYLEDVPSEEDIAVNLDKHWLYWKKMALNRSFENI